MKEPRRSFRSVDNSSTRSAAAGSQRTASGGTKSVRILIAEDNKVNQKVLKRLLETLGYTNISVAWNGQEALDAVKESWGKCLEDASHGRYDIVLMVSEPVVWSDSSFRPMPW